VGNGDHAGSNRITLSMDFRNELIENLTTLSIPNVKLKSV